MLFESWGKATWGTNTRPGVLANTLCDVTKGLLPESHALLLISFKKMMDFFHPLNHGDGLQTYITAAVIQFSICLNCVFANTSRTTKAEDNVDSVYQPGDWNRDIVE